ncbi:hypothetical protein KVR01_000292 [Diaporthe batatas]|uniref:uncharacterized protein n=1 Tax=Diaporthe batatas TaxID=748121 RepID=UPI001D043B57|nr:uncharacterized protein KVR01_000292 [Diaporthe batatas]KAG8169547.1 hypothetical protein KVR01_000292 [Diaporthe batatas]
MPQYRVVKNRKPRRQGQATKQDVADFDSDSELDQHSPHAADRGLRLLPRTSAEQAARRLTRNTQIQPAGIFRPQDHFLAPEQHFPLQTISVRTQWPRYVNRFNSKEMMLVVDGSCVNNGAGARSNQPVGAGSAPKGGLSFIYNDGGNGGDKTTMLYQTTGMENMRGNPPVDLSLPDITGTIAMPLEQKGPRGDTHTHTSNRAKLRAVIAALDFRPWHSEGWHTVVVVTDLEYVALGATRWLPAWVRQGWRAAPRRDGRGRPRPGRKLANRDLWEELQARVEDLRANGTEVAFWLVPPRGLAREDSNLLREAKGAAREAARSSGAELGDYTRLCGLFV